MGLFTIIEGTNADLIKVVSDFYIKDNDMVADVTFGKGVFWKKVDKKRFTLKESDLITVPNKYDLRNLPYKDNYFDVMVLDPPYMHTPGKPRVDERYKNSLTTKKMYHTDIMWEL